MSQTAETGAASDKAVRYTMSGGFVGFLRQRNIAIAATSYQSGRLYLLGRNPNGGLMVNEQFFRKAMGLCAHGSSLHLATLGHIVRMENVLRRNQLMDEVFTECFVPRTIHLTGVLDAHDVGVRADGSVVFVNTRYNCLATLSKEHSFAPVWKPGFISKIVAEDRCHLNGLAMRDGKAAFVSAVCRSDTVDGWRDRRADGGIVIDVESDEIVCSGLSMPHSPRWHAGRLWVLNSGSGEFGHIEQGSGRFVPVAFCPGFVRGLAFDGRHALIGLSRPRYERFEGLALGERLARTDSEPWTGIQVIDLETGACDHWFRIDGPVMEMYDVAVLPGARCAKSLGFATDEALGVVTIGDHAL